MKDLLPSFQARPALPPVGAGKLSPVSGLGVGVADLVVVFLVVVVASFLVVVWALVVVVVREAEDDLIASFLAAQARFLSALRFLEERAA